MKACQSSDLTSKMKNVVVIGTLDTKGPEIRYLRDRLQGLELQTTVVDSGILGEPLDIIPDIDRATAATYGGTTIEALRNAGNVASSTALTAFWKASITVFS